MALDMRSTSHSFLRLLPGIVEFCLIAICLVFISLWRCQASRPPLTWTPQVQDGEIHMGVLGGMLVGLLICFVLACFGSKGWYGYKERVRHALSNWVLVLSICAALVVYFVVLVIASTVKPSTTPPGFWPSLLVHIEENPGGLFIVLTGLPTLYCVALALEQLREVRRAIRSFSELIDRVTAIAKTATPENPLRIVAYTPAVGYLAQPQDEWNLFDQAVGRKVLGGTGKPIAQIVCLHEDALAEWHKLFQGRTTMRGKIDSHLTDEATKAAEHLVKQLLEDRGGNSCANVCRLPFNCLPGYYLFFTKQRAIIVVPLYLPLQLPPELASENQSLPTVQMIGFETTDRAYIKDFELMFLKYFQLSGKV